MQLLFMMPRAISDAPETLTCREGLHTSDCVGMGQEGRQRIRDIMRSQACEVMPSW